MYIGTNPENDFIRELLTGYNNAPKSTKIVHYATKFVTIIIVIIVEEENAVMTNESKWEQKKCAGKTFLITLYLTVITEDDTKSKYQLIITSFINREPRDFCYNDIGVEFLARSFVIVLCFDKKKKKKKNYKKKLKPDVM